MEKQKSINSGVISFQCAIYFTLIPMYSLKHYAQNVNIHTINTCSENKLVHSILKSVAPCENKSKKTNPSSSDVANMLCWFSRPGHMPQ